jgi:hypothetical protein
MPEFMSGCLRDFKQKAAWRSDGVFCSYCTSLYQKLFYKSHHPSAVSISMHRELLIIFILDLKNIYLFSNYNITIIANSYISNSIHILKIKKLINKKIFLVNLS